MTTEAKTKKNTDYSASAVNLKNPPEVQIDLERYIWIQAQIDDLKARLEAYPETQLIAELVKEQSGLREIITAEIQTYGSYQDIEHGHYALKQKAVSKSYNPQPFKDNYIQFAPAVIVEAVNEKALTGLIKGGLLTEQELKDKGVITETESYRFIIK